MAIAILCIWYYPNLQMIRNKYSSIHIYTCTCMPSMFMYKSCGYFIVNESYDIVFSSHHCHIIIKLTLKHRIVPFYYFMHCHFAFWNGLHWLVWLLHKLHNVWVSFIFHQKWDGNEMLFFKTCRSPLILQILNGKKFTYLVLVEKNVHHWMQNIKISIAKICIIL